MLTPEQRAQVEHLFTRYGKGVGSYLLARVGNADVAETLTSRVFLIVAGKFAQCRGSPVPWLWSIVRSEVARYFRDRKATEPLEPGLPDPAPGPPEEAEREELRQRLRQAMDRLPEDQHRLVYMKFFLDLPNTEIAKALGLTASNVGVIAYRALRQLRQRMEEPAREGGGAGRKASDASASHDGFPRRDEG